MCKRYLTLIIVTMLCLNSLGMPAFSRAALTSEQPHPPLPQMSADAPAAEPRHLIVKLRVEVA